MIIKGQARGRAMQLAAHLLAAEQNERIRLYECRGTLAQDVEGALIEMEARGRAARSNQPLYHASISPEAATPLDEKQIVRAVDRLEATLGLHGQPRVVVIHRKKDREHVHVVWSRIDAETGTAISYSWNYRLHERVARELEAAFGHRPVAGRPRGVHKPRRAVADYELRQTERSGIPVSHLTSQLTGLWRASASGSEFKRRLGEAGYTLARGDRRVLVVIDGLGHVHSLARRIEGADTAMVRERMRDIDWNALPSVSEAQGKHKAKAVVGDASRKFTLASREITRQTLLDRTPVHCTARQMALTAKAVTLPEAGVIGPPMRTEPKSTVLSAAIYRSARAALFGDFATRMASARRYLSGETLIAALAVLEAERNAALDALRQSQPLKNARPRKSRLRRRVRVTASRRTRQKPRGY